MCLRRRPVGLQNPKQDKNDEDKENVTNQAEAFIPESVSRLTAHFHHDNIAIIVRGDSSKRDLAFPFEFHCWQLIQVKFGAISLGRNAPN